MEALTTILFFILCSHNDQMRYTSLSSFKELRLWTHPDLTLNLLPALQLGERLSFHPPSHETGLSSGIRGRMHARL